jgi:GAF domain-containing protein
MNQSAPNSEASKFPQRPGWQENDEIKHRLLQNYLSGAIILGTTIFFINLFIAIQKKDLAIGVLTSLLFLILFIITFTKNIRDYIKSLLLSSLFIAVGVMSIISTGISANSVIYFFTAILLLGILLPGSWWIAGLIFEGVTISAIGLFIQYDIIQLNSFFIINNSLLNWFTTITITLFLAFVIVSPLAQYISKSQKLKEEAEKRNTEFGSENVELNKRILALENEADVQRAKQIAARQLVRDMAQATELQRMLNALVDSICNQFSYPFAGIFLSDENNEYTVLQAATGAAGRQMLEDGYRLRIRDEGIVGYVAARGETRLALDVDIDSVHVKNPLLPETRSEIGIPLKTGNKIIGVLDIQSEKQSAFSQEDTDLLQGVADQLAHTIARMHHIEQLEGEVGELRATLGENVRGVWRGHLQGSRKNLAFRYANSQVIPDSQQLLLEAETSNLQTVTVETHDQQSHLVIPIRLRGQLLGVIRLVYQGTKVPARLVRLVNTASDRLAVALENARLLETIQERAEREHLVGEISSKVRSAQTIESILQTAVKELGTTLGVNEVSIQLKTSANTDAERSVEE